MNSTLTISLLVAVAAAAGILIIGILSRRRVRKPSYVELKIPKAQTADIESAERAAVNVYRQVTRRSVRVLKRYSDDHTYIFMVEID